MRAIWKFIRSFGSGILAYFLLRECIHRKMPCLLCRSFSWKMAIDDFCLSGCSRLRPCWMTMVCAEPLRCYTSYIIDQWIKTGPSFFSCKSWQSTLPDHLIQKGKAQMSLQYSYTSKFYQSIMHLSSFWNLHYMPSPILLNRNSSFHHAIGIKSCRTNLVKLLC